jgi:glycosyltransferase involved in cell wall biosynthesis
MKLSVCLITYNHESFISQAIESVLSQKTDYPFQIVIGDDLSTDRTRSICQSYADRFPDKVKLLAREKNLGMISNFTNTLENCKGDYIAFIEGDDYWTDPEKLQTQISFLEKNTEYSLCFHNVVNKFMRSNENAEVLFHKEMIEEEYHTEDLLKQWFIPSSSVVFRNYPDFTIPEWFMHCKSGDIPFLLLLSLRGKLKYFQNAMSVYRIHDSGMSASHNGYEKIIAMMFIYENFNIYTKGRFHKSIRKAQQYEIDRHYPKQSAPTLSPPVNAGSNKSKLLKVLTRRLGL